MTKSIRSGDIGKDFVDIARIACVVGRRGYLGSRSGSLLAVEATFLTGGMTISLFKSLRQHAYALGLGQPQQRFLVQFHRDHVRSYNAVDLHRGLSPLRGLNRT